MTQSLPTRTGGRILVDCLREQGVDMAFCVPGESYLPVLDALYLAREQLKLIVCRQEGGAAFMAEAYGKLTGRPGVCFVTRGPGATNASIGVHTAYQDSSPMILFVGQIGSDVVDREAFQEVDFRRMFGQLSKWVAQIDRAERIPEYLGHAFHLATSGRPGPVVLSLPEDMLSGASIAQPSVPYVRLKAHPGAQDVDSLREMLLHAERPLLIAGGGDWSAESCADLASFARNWSLPVTCSFRRQDLFDNRSPNYAGEIGIAISAELKKRVSEADIIVVLGARLGEMTSSGYSLFGIPKPRQTLVHVHSGVEELGRVYSADLMINAGMKEFSAAIKKLSPPTQFAWKAWTESLHTEYLQTLRPVVVPGTLNMSQVVIWLGKNTASDSIITNGAGNFSGWAQRFYQYTGFRTQLAPTNGAMGYGVPSAIAASLLYPQRTVICFSGDGDFLMNGQELATAAQYGARVIFLVVNNGMYGTIRMHQEKEYPGRVYGTDLVNPDFAALARAYGLHGETVTRDDEFPAAFERARGATTASLIELRIDPEAITSRTTLSKLREQARAAGK